MKGRVRGGNDCRDWQGFVMIGLCQWAGLEKHRRCVVRSDCDILRSSVLRSVHILSCWDASRRAVAMHCRCAISSKSFLAVTCNPRSVLDAVPVKMYKKSYRLPQNVSPSRPKSSAKPEMELVSPQRSAATMTRIDSELGSFMIVISYDTAINLKTISQSTGKKSYSWTRTASPSPARANPTLCGPTTSDLQSATQRRHQLHNPYTRADMRHQRHWEVPRESTCPR